MNPTVKQTYLIAVDLHVLFKIGSRGELFLAELAGVGFLPCVDPLVPYQVANL